MIYSKFIYLSGLIEKIMIKKIALASIFLFCVALFATSCRKYEEGPNISFRKKSSRIAGDWRVESAQVDGIEESTLPYWAKQKHQFYSNNKYIQTIIDPVSLEARTLNGTWALYDHDKRIAITTTDPVTQIVTLTDYNILKLFNKQFWLRTTDNKTELHFVPFD